MSTTRHYTTAWQDERDPRNGTWSVGRERTTKQAAIRQAERLLPPGSTYVATTLSRTVHRGVDQRLVEFVGLRCSTALARR